MAENGGIGGRDGLYDELTREAAVPIQPGMHVEFGLSGPDYRDRRAGFEEVLAGVAWSPDPANEATWPAVSEWTK